MSQFGRRAGSALESFFSGDALIDSQRAVLVLGKRVMHNYRGVPWQLYCQVCGAQTRAVLEVPALTPHSISFTRAQGVPRSTKQAGEELREVVLREEEGGGGGGKCLAVVFAAVFALAHPTLSPRQVVGVFKEMVRRHHVLFSIFCAHDDAQVSLTLTQRVTVGTATMWIGCRQIAWLHDALLSGVVLFAIMTCAVDALLSRLFLAGHASRILFFPIYVGLIP